MDLPAPPLTFHLARASDLPNGTLISIQTPEIDCWIFNGDLIEKPLIIPLLRAARQIVARSTLRETPRDEPWGEMLLVEEDITLAEMGDAWQVTEAGIYAPIPRGLARPQLIRHMAEQGTEHMKWTNPMDIDLRE